MMKTRKPKLRVRLGPAGQGRRMGTEIIGKQGYQRDDEKKKLRKVLREVPKETPDSEDA